MSPVYNRFHPYVLVKITDDASIVRNNFDGSHPFPLDVKSIEINRTRMKAAQSFTVVLNNELSSGTQGYPTGKYTGRFVTDITQYKNDVEMWIGSGSPGTQLIVGTVNEYQHTLRSKQAQLELRGKDRTQDLYHVLIKYKTFKSEENIDYGKVVRDLIKDSPTDIRAPLATVPDVGKNITTSLVFSRQPIYDCLETVANMINYTFFVDVSGNLHFEPIGSIISPVLLSSETNIIDANYGENIEKTKNEIWVFGGRIKIVNELEQAESHTYNTSDNTYYLGHLHVGSIIAVSGTVSSSDFAFLQPRDYLLKDDNWTLQWTSAGSKPDDATSFDVDYLYDATGRVVLIRAADSSLQTNVRKRTKWLYRPEIAANASGTTIDDRYKAASGAAAELAKATLNRMKNPKEDVIVTLEEYVTLEMNETPTVHIPEFGIINSDKFSVKGIVYDYDGAKPIATRITLESLESTEI